MLLEGAIRSRRELSDQFIGYGTDLERRVSPASSLSQLPIHAESSAQVYGRWRKVEELLDPDDVAAGYVVRFRRSPQATIVRSREPAHPAIISVETFTAAQLRRRNRKSDGIQKWSAVERRRISPKRSYALRGLARCGLCSRKMEGAVRRQDVVYYRCNARTLVPGSASALAHPRQIYLREDVVTPAVNRWIGSLFDPVHRSATFEALLVENDAQDHRIEHVEDLRGRVRAAKITMDRVRKALDAGWDPAELREQYNAAAAEKHTAERLLASLPTQETITRAQLEEWIDELGGIGTALNAANRRS